VTSESLNCTTFHKAFSGDFHMLILRGKKEYSVRLTVFHGTIAVKQPENKLVSTPRRRNVCLRYYSIHTIVHSWWRPLASTHTNDNSTRKVKVSYTWICIALCREHTSKMLRYGTRSQGISQFYLHTPRSFANGMDHTCLCLSSRSWYSADDY